MKALSSDRTKMVKREKMTREKQSDRVVVDSENGKQIDTKEPRPSTGCLCARVSFLFVRGGNADC